MRSGRRSRLSALRAVAISTGIVLVTAPLVWRMHVLPTLEELPVGFHRSVDLEGHLELAYDPWTLRPVDPPRTLPFKVTTDIHAKEGHGKNVTLDVRETSQASASINMPSKDQYVLDRHNMRNVASDDAWAGDPGNVVDRSPAYSLSLPPRFDPSKRYPWWVQSTGSIGELSPQHERPVIENLEVARFRLDFHGAPARDLIEEMAGFGLPNQLNPDELHTVTPPGDEEVISNLRASLEAVRPDLRGTVTEALAQPVSVSYVLEGGLVLDFEPRTGALVHVNTVELVLTATAHTEGLQKAASVLAGSADPVGVDLATQIDTLARFPDIEVFSYSLSQTPESTAMVAGIVKESLRKLALAKIWLPLSLGASGLAIIMVAAFPRRRPRDDGEWTASPLAECTGLLEDYGDEWIDIRDKPARSA